MWFVYLIKSEKNKWYYVGSTNRLQKRLFEHNKFKVKSTKAYAPFKLVFKKEFNLEKDAREYERKLKDCRTEKERIIRKLEDNLVNYCGIV
ncbi:GIY-YIG nuclease family protein [Patescibacteria group bacterium]|nr:GIY-YIG nuclease family protein [Patescibacteria group bacterium]MBU4353613.1 GIY-YIG nuclease family protein [Patescibacteria group bacterium]MBU4477030.1 GIY-YIG nuclease family protein [Patescibacteria group bacterium]MCG2698813.1 GIY-YIG nuclease family protein [Candidatus Parcubacteria bacterium]